MFKTTTQDIKFSQYLLQNSLKYIQSNLNNSNTYGTMEICSRYVSSSHERLIMTPGQVANGDNLKNVFVVFLSFRHFVYVERTH